MHDTTNATSATITTNTSTDPNTANSTNTTLERCLSLLEFPEPTLSLFFNKPNIDLDGTPVPALYIRTRIPQLQLSRLDEPDYTIYLNDKPIEIHKVVWEAQCVYENVTADDTALETLLSWLYTADEDGLYDSLRRNNDQYVISFCELVRAFGCVHGKFAGVIRAIYE